MPLKGGSGSLYGELPVDFDRFVLSLLHQRQHFPFHHFQRRDAAIQALAGQRGELDFNHIEPGGSLGREVKREALRKSEGFFGRKSLIEGAFVVGIEVVLHQMNGVSRGVFVSQCFQEQSIFALGALGMHLSQAHSGQGFNGSQQRTGAVFGVGIMLFSDATRLRIEGCDGVPNKEARSLIVAHHRMQWVIGQRIQGQYRLHAGDKPTVDLADTPRLLQVRLQFVFLSMRCTL